MIAFALCLYDIKLIHQLSYDFGKSFEKRSGVVVLQININHLDATRYCSAYHCDTGCPAVGESGFDFFWSWNVGLVLLP